MTRVDSVSRCSVCCWCFDTGRGEEISGGRERRHAIYLGQRVWPHDSNLLPGGWLCDVRQLAQPREQRNSVAVTSWNGHPQAVNAVF